jgi:hypothetical protein
LALPLEVGQFDCIECFPLALSGHWQYQLNLLGDAKTALGKPAHSPGFDFLHCTNHIRFSLGSRTARTGFARASHCQVDIHKPFAPKVRGRRQLAVARVLRFRALRKYFDEPDVFIARRNGTYLAFARRSQLF